MSTTIWLGPISRAQAKQPESADAPVKFAPCTGDGKPNCGDMAEAKGRSLDALADSLGIGRDEAIIGRAFSAGGSGWKRYAANDASRARLKVLTLADATYEVTPGAVAEGFLKFGLDAVDGSKLFVATASGAPNTAGGSKAMTGAETLNALREAIERDSGQLFQPVEVPGLGAGMRLGGNYFFDMGQEYTHGEHATVLAQLVWPNLVVPFLAGDLPPKSGGSSAPSGSTPPTWPTGAGGGSPIVSSGDLEFASFLPGLLMLGGAATLITIVAYVFATRPTLLDRITTSG